MKVTILFKGEAGTHSINDQRTRVQKFPSDDEIKQIAKDAEDEERELEEAARKVEEMKKKEAKKKDAAPAEDDAEEGEEDSDEGEEGEGEEEEAEEGEEDAEEGDEEEEESTASAHKIPRGLSQGFTHLDSAGFFGSLAVADEVKDPLEKSTVIVSGFPGIGKSHFFDSTDLDVSDSDSSGFDKAQFPQNYINHIKSLIGIKEVILVSSHDAVRQALVDNGINFVLVYPTAEQKQSYLLRYAQRGSPKAFVDMMDSKWEEFLGSCNSQQGCTHIVLAPGEYLADAYEKYIG